MLPDELNAADEKARANANVDALAHVAAASLPDKVHLARSSFAGIGRTGQERAGGILARLQEECSDRLPEVVANSIRMSAFSLAAGAAYMAHGRALGIIGDNEYTEQFITPEGYGEREGIAWTLYGHVHSLEHAHDLDLVREVAKCDDENARLVSMYAFALYWFSLAGDAAQTQRMNEALTALAEAFDAVALADFDRGWTASAEGKTSSIGHAAAVLSRKGTDARHRENRAMRAQVFEWLDSNTFRSLDAAAEALAGKIVPVTFRTARDWAGQWKKLRDQVGETSAPTEE